MTISLALFVSLDVCLYATMRWRTDAGYKQKTSPSQASS